MLGQGGGSYIKIGTRLEQFRIAWGSGTSMVNSYALFRIVKLSPSNNQFCGKG